MKYKEMLKRKGSKNSDGTSINGKSDQPGVVEEAHEDSCGVLMAESGKDKYSDAWLLDAGCTYHMCPKREWFSTYKHYNGGSVLMGYNAVCKTVGIDNIRMRMFDGQLRTLTNVRYILDLKKNLLSLGALEAREYKFFGADGTIKVTKGFMTVLKGERTTNLYKLTGSIIIGDASAAATEKEDTTRLWHMHLGHMSERGLQVLHKRVLYQVSNIANLIFVNFTL